MIFIIIYLLGIIYGILCALDVSKKEYLKTPAKIALSAVCILFSWVGSLYYSYIGRMLLDKKHLKK